MLQIPTGIAKISADGRNFGLACLHRVRFPFLPLHFGAMDRSLADSMKAKVIVMPKKSVLDPQGVAVREAIHHHGVPSVKSVRVGKFMEIEVDGADQAQLDEICRDLLSNPVIEDYTLEIEGEAS